MPQANSTKSSRGGWIIPGAAAAALLLLGGAGYLLYLHTGSILQRGHTLPPLLILALALIGGAASFFSPCGIAITPAFLAYLSAKKPPDDETPILSGPLVHAALLVASGIVLFYAAAGSLVGLVGNIAYNYLIYFVPVVGLAFLALGALILLGRIRRLAFVERWNPMNRVYARQEVRTSVAGMPRKRTLFAFGFAYGAASHTCSLPIFLGILLVPLVAGNYPLAALSIFVYGLAMAVLVVVMMVLGQRVFTSLRRWGQTLMRVSAVLFIATGAFLFVYFGQNYGPYLNRGPAKAMTALVLSHRYRLTVGADATGYPYAPRTLYIPARHVVQVAVTDHVGGCLLRTIFEGLGPEGGTVEITVPVGDTRVVQLYAPRPGRYAFHCGAGMYSGTVVAR